MTPYAYLLGWKSHNKWYYGVRYGRNCDPADLWKTYFTSSGYVHDFVKQYGPPDHIEVRKTFKTSHFAKYWEARVLKSIPKAYRVNWLNARFSIIGYRTCRHTTKSKAAIAKAQRSMIRSRETRKKMAIARTLYWANKVDRSQPKAWSAQHSNDMKSYWKTHSHSEEARQKMREAQQRRWAKEKGAYAPSPIATNIHYDDVIP